MMLPLSFVHWTSQKLEEKRLINEDEVMGLPTRPGDIQDDVRMIQTGKKQANIVKY